MTEVTRILSAIEEGDSHAAEQLLPLVYAYRQWAYCSGLAARPAARRTSFLLNSGLF